MLIMGNANQRIDNNWYNVPYNKGDNDFGLCSIKQRIYQIISKFSNEERKLLFENNFKLELNHENELLIFRLDDGTTVKKKIEYYRYGDCCFDGHFIRVYF